ncbi:MFS transporter, partial [bacterium]|nr:MFS transporter [bacterium]
MSENKSIWNALANRRMLICIFNGFTAGLPLYFIYHLIPAWLRSEGIDLKTIGLFSLVGIPYTWKFIWSPVMDRYTPPFLGRRRGWMLITQIALFLSMGFLGSFDPKESIWTIAYIAVALAFFSASQDISLDAYRRELLPDEELGLGNSMYMNGYRAAVFVPGGLGLILADHLPWSVVHILIGSFMLVGIIKTLLISEVNTDVPKPKSLREAVIDPFKEFFGRKEGVKSAFLLLAFLLFYKIGDNMATALSTPFYLDLG